MNFKYSNLTPFKWCIIENFPFIEADFDAITNYQLFCKVVEYLNKTIDSTNILGQKVQEFSEYFDNLDVQEEINNKLDKMAIDGSLLNIIKKYINPILEEQNNKINNIDNKVSKIANGSPLVASSISEMEDTSKIYVNTTDGYWYYYNGSEWVKGGIYQTAEDSKTVEMLKEVLVNVINITSYEKIEPDVTNNGKIYYQSGTTTDNKGVVGILDSSTINSVQLNNIKSGEKFKIDFSYFNSNIAPGYIFAHVENGQNIIDEIFFDENVETYKTITKEVITPELSTRLFVNGLNFIPNIEKNIGEQEEFKSKSYNKETIDEMILHSENDYAPLRKKPTIIFDFDESAFDNRASILKEYGFSATFAFGGNLDNNISDIKKLVNNGFDISLYQGYGERPTDYNNYNSWYNFINALVEKAESIGIYKPIMYSCFGHKGGDVINQICKKLGFKYVRSTFGINLNGETIYYPENNNPSDIVQFPITMEDKTVEQIKNIINNSINNNYKKIMLMCHSVDGNIGHLKESDFIEIVQYVKNLYDMDKINVLNMHEYYDLWYPIQNKNENFNRLLSGIIKR